MVEYTLKSQGYTFRWMIVLRGNLVYSLRTCLAMYKCGLCDHVCAYLPEVTCAVQGLQQRVHIAGCALVFETNIAGFLLRIIAVVIVSEYSVIATRLLSTYLTKLCQSTPVGSSKTRTKTLTSADSSSIVGREWPSWMLNNFRSSLKRVKPQSHSSAMKR